MDKAKLLEMLFDIGSRLVDTNAVVGKTNLSTVSGGTLLAAGSTLLYTGEPISQVAGAVACVVGLCLMKYRDSKAKDEKKEDESK